MLFNVKVMTALEFERLLAVWWPAPFHLCVFVFRMALVTWNDCLLIECTQEEERLLRVVYGQGGVITVQGTERWRLLVLSSVVLNGQKCRRYCVRSRVRCLQGFGAETWGEIDHHLEDVGIFIHSLVFSLRGRADRNQSPVMWPVWLWHTSSWASSWE